MTSTSRARESRESREYGKLYPVAKAILSPPFRLLWRVRTRGVDNVPVSGPAIMCPNHISVLDSFFVPLVLPRRVTFVGKAEYLDSWKTRYLFPAMGMIPLDRSGGSAAERALAAATRVLERGELFCIYPEGTRSRNGKLHRGHTGAARLALRTGAPLVPVGIEGTDRIQPPDAKLPKPFRPAEVSFGEPITVDRYRERAEHDHLVLRQLTDELMFAIRELSGQTYVDSYATKRAEDVPTEPAVVAPVGAAPVGANR